MAADPIDRFYGVEVPALAKKLCRERLTYANEGTLELVTAHLRSNFAYFGSLDKTLAGLYVLDDRGDDYTLLDLRSRNGEVYLLDHDDLDLTVRFRSLADYAAWRGSAKLDAQLPRAQQPRPQAKPEPVALWRRYRSLVWLLAQPKQVDDEEAIATALEQTRITCGGKYGAFADAFARERKQLAKDPQLAIWWLLWFTCTGQRAEREQVVAAVAGVKTELVRAFVATFGAMTAASELPVLPAWRKRRSRFVFELAPKLAEDPFELLLEAFAIDPVDRGLDKARAVWAHATTPEARERVAAAVADAPGKSPAGDKAVKGAGADYLRAELAALSGKRANTRALLAHDPYDPRYLELAGKDVDEAKRADELLAALEAATAKAKQKAKTLADLDKGTGPALAAIGKAKPALRELVARRIVQNHRRYTDAAIARAYDILSDKLADDAELAAKTTAAVMGMSGYELVDAIGKRAKRNDAGAVAQLWRLVEFDEREANEYHALYVKRAALAALGKQLLQRARFTAWLALFDRKGLERLTSESLAILDPDAKGSLVTQLSPAQRVELVLALLARKPGRHTDPARDVLAALDGKALRTQLARAVARDPARKARLAKLVDDLDGD